MRVTVVLVLLALSGCTKKSDPSQNEQGAPPKADSGAKQGAPTALPDPAAAPPRIETFDAVEGLVPALEQAATCVADGNMDRRCAAFIKVRKSVVDHERDDAWADALLAAAQKRDPAAQVALVLLDEVSAGDNAKYVEQLWPMVAEGDDPAIRTAALRALYARLGPAHADQVTAVLSDDEAPASLRAAAAYLAVKPAMEPNTKKLAPLLVKLMSDPELTPALRRAAIAAAGKLGHPTGQAAIIKLLDDPMLGANATVNLAGFHTREAYQVLWKRLEVAADGGPLQVAQIAAIGRLDQNPSYDEAAVTALLHRLLERLGGDVEKGVREAPMMRSMVQRHIDRLRKAKNLAAQKAAAAAGEPPAPAPKAPAPKKK